MYFLQMEKLAKEDCSVQDKVVTGDNNLIVF